MRPRPEVVRLGERRQHRGDIHVARGDTPVGRRRVIDLPRAIAITAKSIGDLFGRCALALEVLRVDLENQELDPAIGERAPESGQRSPFSALDIHLQQVDLINAGPVEHIVDRGGGHIELAVWIAGGFRVDQAKVAGVVRASLIFAQPQDAGRVARGDLQNGDRLERVAR